MPFLRDILYCLMVLATAVIMKKKTKTKTEETVTLPFLAFLEEEFLFCVSLWGTWCCFLHKVSNNIVADRLKEEGTYLTKPLKFCSRSKLV